MKERPAGLRSPRPSLLIAVDGICQRLQLTMCKKPTKMSHGKLPFQNWVPVRKMYLAVLRICDRVLDADLENDICIS